MAFCEPGDMARKLCVLPKEDFTRGQGEVLLTVAGCTRGCAKQYGSLLEHSWLSQFGNGNGFCYLELNPNFGCLGVPSM